MTRPQLLFVEGFLVIAGLLLLVALFGVPFTGGSGGDDTSAEAGVVVTERPPQGGGIFPTDNGDGTADAPLADPPVEACTPPTDRDFFSANQILSFYGNPYTEHLGILGELEPDALVARLREMAAIYDAENKLRGVQPAFHMIASTAQPNPGNDGLYVLHVDEDTIQEWVDLACREGLLVFLDLQIGRNTLDAEIGRIEKFLALPNVHLALDPEFAMHGDEVPGEVIGGFDADEINHAQALLDEIIEENNLPDKVLVVHQFQDNMIQRPEALERHPRIRMIVDMDGFGEPAAKVSKYKTFAQPAEYSGIKLFFKQDQPNMTPAEVLKLYPDLIIYQ